VISLEPLHATGLIASNCEARRMIKPCGVKLHGEKIDNAEMEVGATVEIALQAGKGCLVRVFFV